MSMQEKSNKGSYYPVYLNLAGKNCLVVGGGEVACRKTLTLLECGAIVTVISPALCPDLAELAESRKVHAIIKEFTPEDMIEAFLVISATDRSEVNEQVAAAARKKRIPVNVVDNAGLSDFILPASLKRGDLSIAVSTSGKSPALARKLRDHLESRIGREYGALADLVAEVRSEMKAAGLTTPEDVWQKALDLDLLTHLLRNGERDKAKTWLRLKLAGPVDV